MKTVIAFATICFLAPWSIGAGELLVFFVPQHESRSYAPDGAPQVGPNDLKAAQNIENLLPAELLPGRWGPAENGLQISLKLDKNSFQTNEQIKATILIRNIGDQEALVRVVRAERMFDFEVRDEHGIQVPFSDRLVRFMAGGPGFESNFACWIGLRRQIQFLEDIRYRFSFPPSGKFTVKVRFGQAESNEAWFSIGTPDHRAEESLSDEAQQWIKRMEAIPLMASNFVAVLPVQPVPKTNTVRENPGTNVIISAEEQRIWAEWRRTNSARIPATPRSVGPLPAVTTNTPENPEPSTGGSGWPVIVALIVGAGIAFTLWKSRSGV